MCSLLIDRIKDYYPDVRVQYWDGDDKYIQKFQRRNLGQPVASIKNPQLRQQYEQQGIRVLHGLPTIYITSTERPMRILDLSIGSVNLNASKELRSIMTEDLQSMFRKARHYDKALNTSSASAYIEIRGAGGMR